MSTSLRPSFVPSPTPTGIGEAVEKALSTAFEDMVFMEVSSMQDYARTDVAPIWSRVATQAPLRAELLLRMSPTLVDACIDAMYAGIDPNDGLRHDVVRELLNIISGLVMSNLTETEAIDLGLPESGVGAISTASTDAGLTKTHTSDVGGLALTVHWS